MEAGGVGFRSLVIGGGLIFLICWAAGANPAPFDKVQVFCWDLTPTTTRVLQGLAEGLGQVLPVVSADGSSETGQRQVRRLRREKLRLLVVLGTPALILAAPVIKETPVVFAQVSDPYQTGAAYHPDQPEDHQANITGLASPPPLAEAIREFRRLFPTKSHWGLIYDPADGSSQELRQRLTLELAMAGQTLTVVAWHPSATAAGAVQELLAQGVEVAYLPPDGAASRYATALFAAGQAGKLVVINGNPGLREPGAILQVSLDYVALGRETAALVRRILAGEKPKNIPIATVKPLELTVAEDLLVRWLGYPPGRGQ